MSALGTVALDLALIFIGVSVFAALYGKRRENQALLTLSRRSAYAVAALLTLAVLTLLYLIFTNDFAVKTVQTSSSRSLAWYFKLSLLWVDLESSLLFWAWILAILSAAAIATNRRKLAELVPHATVTLMLVLAFFVYLLQFHKNPFDEYLMETPSVGNGMRLMLRNPWMLVHPPAQYLGYIFTTVPFAFCLAAMARPVADQEDEWISVMRPWMMLAWLFLGVGLVLGMIWAYELIDWGGWWSWDPVENAALIPWFTATALVHSVVIFTKRKLMRGWVLAMILTTFWFTILGTFMTRSGIVRSVHSFGKDEALTWSFAIFMAVGMAVSYGLLLARTTQRREQQRGITSFISLEYSFVLANWLFFICAIFVLMASLYPTFSELLFKKRVTVGAPFFDKYMAPLGMVLLFLTALAPVLPWHGIKLRRLAEVLFWPVTAMVAVAFFMAVTWPSTFPLTRPMQVVGAVVPVPTITATQICVGLCALLFGCVIQDFVRLARARQRSQGEPLLLAIGRTLAKGRRRYGAHFVHLGVALMFLGFAGKGHVVQMDRVLQPGDSFQIAGLEIRYEGMTFNRGLDADAVQAVIVVREEGEVTGEGLLPATKIYYENPSNPMSEVAFARGFGRDLHLRLAGRRGQSITLKLAIHPLVSWIWLGFLALCIGAIICLVPAQRVRPIESRAPARKKGRFARLRGWGWPGLAVAASTVAGLVLLAVFLWPSEPKQGSVAGFSWVLGAAAAATGAVCAWAFGAFAGSGAREADANVAPEVPKSTRRARLIQDLRELADAETTGKLGAEQHAAFARGLRWELATILAEEDAEALREALRDEVARAGGSGSDGRDETESDKAAPSTTDDDDEPKREAR